MSPCRRFFGIRNVLIWMALLILGPVAFASDRNPGISKTHIIPSAVRLQITPRGMKYFDSRLSDILGNLGLSLDEGYFKPTRYEFPQAMKVSDYAASNPELVKIYSQVRDLMTKWLVGFSLNEHKPVIAIGESGYEAQFSRFGLVTDEALMNTLGKRDGAILAIELEVKKMVISTTSITAWDSQNEFLGKVGLENVTVIAGSKEAPLKLRLPFYIRMNSQGGLDFEALNLQHNLDSVPVAMKYKKLITPQISIEINGKKFQMNTAELDVLLNEKAPVILSKLKDYLGEFASKQMPELLNQKANEFLNGRLEQIQDMIPPGQVAGDRRPNFKWGLQLQNIGLKKTLNIDLSAYVEDPTNPTSQPRKADKSRGVPNFNIVNPGDYDLALSIDRALINRVLQLSFERRNFENIRQSDGTTLRLMAAPSIDYAQNTSFVRLHVMVENQPNSMFLKRNIVVGFDIFARLRQLKDKSGLQLMLNSIDVDSLTMDDQFYSFSGSLFKTKVLNGIRDQLREISDRWRAREEAIPGSLPLPPEIMGIKLDIHKVTMDPQGHLVMFLEYAKGGAKK